jgi:hypothetical protein
VNKNKVILDKDTLPLAQKAGWMFFTSMSIAEFRDRVSEEKFKKDTLNLFDINYLDGEGNLLILHALKSKEEKK